MKLDKSAIPSELKSPAYVLRSRIGTCFELSTVLVSLLIGNGHDAYVVSGFATKQCCENDQTYTKCPHYLQEEFDELFQKPVTEEPDIIHHEEDLGRSQFWKMMDQRKKDALDENIRQQAEAERLRIQELEQIPPDPLHGKRIHSWVLLIVDNSIKFIEPTIGTIHEQFDEKYLTIESVWNDENYWVNMNPNVPAKDLCFDLNNLQHWEHLLVCEPWSVYSKMLKFDQQNDLLALKHFRMPSSWVDDLEIPEQKFEDKFPHGHHIILYRKTKYERFNKSYNSDGSISCLTQYNDYACTEANAVIKQFHNRGDKLDKIKMNLQNNRIIEEFDYDRKDTLRRLEYLKNQKPFWNGLKLKFYYAERLDGLASFDATRHQIQINFNNRLDHLLSYSIHFNQQTVPENIKHAKDSITKIIEKFSKNHTIDIDTREYTTDQVLITYHYKKEEIFQKRQRYRKPVCLSCETKLVLHCDCKKNIKFKNKNHEIEFTKLLDTEKSCITAVWNILNEVQDIEELRQSERVFQS